MEFSPTLLKNSTKVHFFVVSKKSVFFQQPVVFFISCNTYFHKREQKSLQSLVSVRVISTFLFVPFKVEINFSLHNFQNYIAIGGLLLAIFFWGGLPSIYDTLKLLRDFFLMSKHSIIYSNKINEKS